MNHLLRTSNLGPTLFMPWLNFDDLYVLRLTCKAFNDMTTLMRCLKDNIRRNLLSLLNGNQKVMDQFLELWTKKPGANVWLTGSTLLWCLQPSSPYWEPKDMDVVLFRSPGQKASSFIPPTMEPAYAERDEEAPDKAQYARMLEESMCVSDNRFMVDGKRLWIRRPMRLVQGPLVDAIFAFGDEKTSPWMHLKAFDLNFLQNAWNPKTNKLCLYGVRSLYYRASLHSRRDTDDSFHRNYWRDRRDKYRERGYNIVDPPTFGHENPQEQLIQLEQKSEQQRADAAASREVEIAEYWAERRHKREKETAVFKSKRAKLSK